MPRGRPATPTALKELAGNPGKRALNKREPMPTGALTAPSVLSTEGLKVWKRLVSTSPNALYKAPDEFSIAAFCEAVAGWREATRAISERGRYAVGSTGQMTVAPWVKDQAEQARLVMTFGARLGLDPVARANMMVPEEEADDGWNIH